MNSWLHNIPTLQTGAPRSLVNPGDAERVGLVDGATAKVYNDQGEMQVPVEISGTLCPGSCAIPTAGHEEAGWLPHENSQEAITTS